MIEAARGWVEAVHPSAPHLVRTLEWVDALQPGAREALRIAEPPLMEWRACASS